MRLRWRVVLLTALILAVAMVLYGPGMIAARRDAARREAAIENMERIEDALKEYEQNPAREAANGD